MRSSILLAFSMLATSPLQAQERMTDAEKMMGAASVILQLSTVPSGSIQVASGSLATSAGGATFRKLAECVYGEEFQAQGATYLQTIDFTGLTGRYEWGRAAMVGKTIVFAGQKPRTRCFQVAGNSGCKADLELSHIGQSDIARAINDVTYILSHGCAASDADPY